MANAGDAGVSASVANLWATVKSTFALTEPLVAEIDTAPSPTDVTVALVPLPVTVATLALLEVNVTDGLASAD